MTASESILTSTKNQLGLADDYTIFDDSIIMYINATLADINQLGIGPSEGFTITDKTATWYDLIGNEKRYEGVKAYMYLCVRMLFDPPSVGYVITAFEKLKEKAEWRLNRAREDIVQEELENGGPLVVTNGSDLDSTADIFSVTGGLPFSRSIRITNGKTIWNNLADFESKMQIRETKDPASALKYDFSPHLNASFDTNDIVIAWSLTGEQTRLLPSGYYDLVVSDTGPSDARAIRALYGFISVDSLITT